MKIPLQMNQNKNRKTSQILIIQSLQHIKRKKSQIKYVRKKKKLHRRKVRKHSPEYYQRKKQIKLNKKKQKNWDSHFINDVIPGVVIKSKNKPKRTLSRLDDRRQQVDMKNPKSNHTININIIKGQILSQADKSKKAKSFNIRVVNNQTNQNGQSNNQIQKQSENNQQSKANAKTQKTDHKKGSTIKVMKVQDDQLQNQKAQYNKKIDYISKQMKFINCHKQVLQSFLSTINKKYTKQIIDKQLIKLKAKNSQIFKITETIEKRQTQLLKVKNTAKQQRSIFKVPYQIVDNFRISSLACIQEILKWKQNWQNLYLQIFQKQISFDLIYKVENYLLTMLNSGDQLLNLYISEQNTSKTATESNEHNNQTDNKKKNIKIKDKDPFLISIFGLEKQSKQIILKIRACQLLLLQEQYNCKNK